MNNKTPNYIQDIFEREYESVKEMLSIRIDGESLEVNKVIQQVASDSNIPDTYHNQFRSYVLFNLESLEEKYAR